RRLAPATARRLVSNRPKQVAPEPDMRASRQPGNALNAASTSPITGAMAIAGASRSLRPCATCWISVAAVGRGPDISNGDATAPLHPAPTEGALRTANTSLVDTATRGFTSTAGR